MLGFIVKLRHKSLVTVLVIFYALLHLNCFSAIRIELNPVALLVIFVVISLEKIIDY